MGSAFANVATGTCKDNRRPRCQRCRHDNNVMLALACHKQWADHTWWFTFKGAYDAIHSYSAVAATLVVLRSGAGPTFRPLM